MRGVTAGSDKYGSPEDDGFTEMFVGTGTFQRCLLGYSMLATMTMGLQNHVLVLMAAKVNHWCAPREGFGNLSTEEWKADNIPLAEDGSYSQCDMYDVPLSLSLLNRSVVPCATWQYDESEHVGTIIQQWDLVCGNTGLLATSTATFHVGSLVGFTLSGFFSERIGRKPVICASAGIALTAGLLVATVRTLFAFSCLRFLVGAAISAVALTSFVLIMELVPTESRGFYAVLTWTGFGGGILAASIAAEFELTWQMLQVLSMLPTVALLSGFTCLQESPRWLISRWKLDRAKVVVMVIAKRNGKNTEEILGSWHTKRLALETEEQKKPPTTKAGACCMLCTPKLRYVNLILSCSWFAVSLTFCAMTFDLRGSARILLEVTAAAAFSARIITYWGIERFGRRPTLSVSLLLISVACIGENLFGKGDDTRNAALVTIALFFISMADTVIALYVTEANPAAVRAVALCVGSVAGRIGGILASYADDLALATAEEAPRMVYAMSCAVAGVLVSLLPETRPSHLPDPIRKRDLFDIAPLRVRRDSAKKKKRRASVSSLVSSSGLGTSMTEVENPEVSRGLIGLVRKGKPRRESMYHPRQSDDF